MRNAGWVDPDQRRDMLSAWALVKALARQKCTHRFRRKADDLGAFCRCLPCQAVRVVVGRRVRKRRKAAKTRYLVLKVNGPLGPRRKRLTK